MILTAYGSESVLVIEIQLNFSNFSVWPKEQGGALSPVKYGQMSMRTPDGNYIKSILRILFPALLAASFSCKDSPAKKEMAIVATDSSKWRMIQNEREQKEAHERVEERERRDSIQLAKVLARALTKANREIYKDRFHIEYEDIPDSDFNVKVQIGLNHFFTKDFPHLIIRREAPNNICIDIYTKKGNKFQKSLSRNQWVMEYVNDTIRDINGDGINDFVVNCYGVNGCCLKAFSNVYILRSNKREFSDNFEFINPTFSPKEKIIRGVCYGHPGDTEMYKYKWNGEHIDTVEYVSYEKVENGVKTGKIVISKSLPYRSNYKILSVRNSVPSEYRRIEGYDWFTGDY